MTADFPRHAGPSVFVVMSGPSGAGKSTLLRRFLHRNPDFLMSISVTTRPPRSGEVDGRDYDFITDAVFQDRRRRGDFIESAQVFGTHWYGTPRTFIEERFTEGRSVIKDIDVQGADQIRASYPKALFVYVVPPSIEEIERRLRGRSTETEAAIRARLEASRAELARWRDYQYLIINADLDQAEEDLAAIVRGHRLQIAR